MHYRSLNIIAFYIVTPVLYRRINTQGDTKRLAIYAYASENSASFESLNIFITLTRVGHLKQKQILFGSYTCIRMFGLHKSNPVFENMVRKFVQN